MRKHYTCCSLGLLFLFLIFLSSSPHGEVQGAIPEFIVNVSVGETGGHYFSPWLLLGCSNKADFQGRIGALPTMGTLEAIVGTGRQAKPLMITQTNQNQFHDQGLSNLLYIPNTATPQTDEMVINEAIEECFGNDPKIGTMKIKFNVQNFPPVAQNHRYASAKGLVRNVMFPAQDIDQNLKSVELISLTGTEGCKIFRWNYDEVKRNITTHEIPNSQIPGYSMTYPTHTYQDRRTGQVKTKVDWRLLKVTVAPPPQVDGSASNYECILTWKAVDSSGVKSQEAQATVYRLEASEQKATMTAFGGHYVVRSGIDNYKMISLRSAAIGGVSMRHFFIDELPAVGKLYLRGVGGGTTTDVGNYTKSLEITKVGEVHNLGRYRRRTMRLFYVPPSPKLLATAAAGTNTSVIIKWHFSIHNEKSAANDHEHEQTSGPGTIEIDIIPPSQASQGPTCGVTTLDPVYVERPFVKIPWNYTVAPGGDISRIVLYSVPNNAAGDFYATRTSFDLPADGNFEKSLGNVGVQKLRHGSFFNDRRQNIFFRIKPGYKPNWETTQQLYRIRVMDYHRRSCIGWIRVVIRSHNFVKLADGSLSGSDKAIHLVSKDTKGTAVRNEVALIGRYNLMPLRGLANASVAKNKQIVGIQLVSEPRHGVLWKITEGAPLIPRMYGTYCRRVDCSKWKDVQSGPLHVGSSATAVAFDNFDTQDTVKLLHVLYQVNSNFKGNNVLDRSHAEIDDSFSYRFLTKGSGDDDKEVSSWTQKVAVTLRRGYNTDIIKFTYSKPVPGQPQQVYEALDLEAAIRQLKPQSSPATGKMAIDIKPKKSFSTHGEKAQYRLHQLKAMDGTHALPGAEISAPFIMNGQRGLWVNGPVDKPNTLVFAPSINTHRQRFSFRVRVWDADKMPASDLDYDEFKVRVERRNTPPTWDTPNQGLLLNWSPYQVNGTDESPMFFSVNDVDNDDISFVVGTVPKYGTLEYRITKPTGRISKKIHRGTRIRMYRSSEAAEKQLAMIVYTHNPSTATFVQYPLHDSFSIYASDGGSRTPVWIQNLTVVNRNSDGRLSSKKNLDQRRSRILNSTAIAIGALVTLSLVVFAVITVVKRRQMIRRKYQAMPVVVTQQPAAVKITPGGADA